MRTVKGIAPFEGKQKSNRGKMGDMVLKDVCFALKYFWFWLLNSIFSNQLELTCMSTGSMMISSERYCGIFGTEFVFWETQKVYWDIERMSICFIILPIYPFLYFSKLAWCRDGPCPILPKLILKWFQQYWSCFVWSISIKSPSFEC